MYKKGSHSEKLVRHHHQHHHHQEKSSKEQSTGRRSTCAYHTSIVIDGWGSHNSLQEEADQINFTGPYIIPTTKFHTPSALPYPTPTRSHFPPFVTSIIINGWGSHNGLQEEADQIKFSRSLDTGRSVKSGSPVPRCTRLDLVHYLGQVQELGIPGLPSRILLTTGWG